MFSTELREVTTPYIMKAVRRVCAFLVPLNAGTEATSCINEALHLRVSSRLISLWANFISSKSYFDVGEAYSIS